MDGATEQSSITTISPPSPARGPQVHHRKNLVLMSQRQIPGYDYDPHTDRYYKVQQTSKMSAYQAHQLEERQRAKEEASLQKLAASSNSRSILSVDSLGFFARDLPKDFYLGISQHHVSFNLPFGPLTSALPQKVLHPRLLPARSVHPSGPAGTLLQIVSGPNYLLEIGQRDGQMYVVSRPLASIPLFAPRPPPGLEVGFLASRDSLTVLVYKSSEARGLVFLRPTASSTLSPRLIPLDDGLEFGIPLHASVSPTGQHLVMSDAESCLIYELAGDLQATLTHTIPASKESISCVLLKRSSPIEYFIGTRSNRVLFYSDHQLKLSYTLPAGECGKTLWFDERGGALYVQTHHHRLYMLDEHHPLRATMVFTAAVFSDPDLQRAIDQGAEYEVDLQNRLLYMTVRSFVFVWALCAPSRLLASWGHDREIKSAFLALDGGSISRLYLEV